MTQGIKFGVSPTPSPRRLLRSGSSSISPPVFCSAAEDFIARTSGLDTLHQTAVADLICGLVDDGIYSRFDFLYATATQDSVTSVLNLVSPNYDGSNSGAHFVVDRGMTGGPGGHIYSGFNPATAISPNFTQNSAHISLWCMTEVGPVNDGPMGVDEFVNGETEIHPFYGDGNSYYRVNSDPISGVPNSTSIGFYLANRATANQVKGYKNGTNVLINNGATSKPVKNHDFPICAIYHMTAGTIVPAAHQLGIASMGSSLSDAEVLIFYNRLHTYLTAIGAI